MYLHRQYLKAAGIPWEDAEGRRVDVHALRHTYNTVLAARGVNLAQRQRLMRQTDPKLTAVTYIDAQALNLVDAGGKFPLPPRNPVPTGGALQQDPERLAGGLAGISISLTLSSAVTVSGVYGVDVVQVLENASDAQQKTPIVSDGGQAPQVGLEPTTSRLTAGCSTIELLRNGLRRALARTTGKNVIDAAGVSSPAARSSRDFPAKSVRRGKMSPFRPATGSVSPFRPVSVPA